MLHATLANLPVTEYGASWYLVLHCLLATTEEIIWYKTVNLRYAFSANGAVTL